ncbi:hypothetical protein AAHH67_12270 [Niallia circulans]
MKNRKETGEEIKLGEEFGDCDYSEYLIGKVNAASSKYGLLFFEDDEVMKDIYKKLKVHFPDKDKDKEPTLPETIGLLIKKLF